LSDVVRCVVPLLLVPLLIVLALVALVPIALVQRYRMGTARQRARGWLATINVAGVAFSAAILLASAALASVWVPGALKYTAGGLAGGCVLGVAGLWLTRWEHGPGRLHYTPNRWLVLAITLLVTGRILFGFWRAWHTWGATAADRAWFATTGVVDSMAAGAVVLGYYLAYWIGVRSRIRRHSARRMR
jgi:hypothetical protein